MNAKTPRPLNHHGFSLVELLVVILIIAILMSLTIVGTRFAMTKGYASKTAIQLKALESGIEKFYNDRMEYPNPIDGNAGSSSRLYIALTGDGITAADLPPNKPAYAGTATDGALNGTDEQKWTVYLEELLAPGGNKSLQKWIDTTSRPYKIIDGFGEEIRYRCTPATPNNQKNTGYDLWSYGTDASRTPTNEAKWLKNW